MGTGRLAPHCQRCERRDQRSAGERSRCLRRRGVRVPPREQPGEVERSEHKPQGASACPRQPHGGGARGAKKEPEIEALRRIVCLETKPFLPLILIGVRMFSDKDGLAAVGSTQLDLTRLDRTQLDLTWLDLRKWP